MANEKRLIDANAIYKAVEQRYKISSGIEHRCESALLELICAEDTVDAVEVVHGRWIRKSWWQHKNHYEIDNCSVCGHQVKPKDAHNYCPHCGAKMDGDGNG